MFCVVTSLTCQSDDIMASLCGMDVRVCVSDFSKTTRPRDMLFFLKIAYLPGMKNCSRHADLFVSLFARAIISEVPPTLSMKILTLYHNFLSDYCRDFSNILHICTSGGGPIHARVPIQAHPQFSWKIYHFS